VVKNQVLPEIPWVTGTHPGDVDTRQTSQFDTRLVRQVVRSLDAQNFGTEVLLAARLRPPIDGISVESFKGHLTERRGNHRHEAVDIVVPRGTPVHAVQDRTIGKLFLSKAGGMAIYQFDSYARLCYYYAHLDRYANGLHDGQHISSGDVIGYVGTSGNAPGTPHLHFAIFQLDAREMRQGGGGRDRRDRSGDAVQTFARHRVPLYFIAGPPEMVKDLHATLTKQSVNEAISTPNNSPAIERSGDSTLKKPTRHPYGAGD
jgi:peptidoglycan LD-endopeptidase LytH